jgi:DNA-binding NtrC family response regulator
MDYGGLRVLDQVQSELANTEIIIISSVEDEERMKALKRRGADKHIVKPINEPDLRWALNPTLKRLGIGPLREGHVQPDVIVTPGIRTLIEEIQSLAPTDLSVLVFGPRGSGKEMIARQIHLDSQRSQKPFVTVNCGGLPESLIESLLFGHVENAFTGAKDQVGLFEAANGGTIFLDEIGNMPSWMQQKLYRVLQEGEVLRVGTTKPIKVDVRVVSATNRDLDQAVDSGAFAADLLDRLNQAQIIVPALGARVDDIEWLAPLILDRFAAKPGGVKSYGVTGEAMAALRKHSWPGNVRELETVLNNAALQAKGEPIAPLHLNLRRAREGSDAKMSQGLNCFATLDANISTLFENQSRLLREIGKTNKEIWEIMDISKSSLYRKRKSSE